MKPTSTTVIGAPHIGTALIGLACALCVAGCQPVPSTTDAGDPGDAMTNDVGVAAAVAVRLAVDPGAVEGDAHLDLMVLGVVSVRAPNDRGDLTRDFGRSADVTLRPVELMLEGAEPAVYGSVEIMLGNGAWGHALELQLVDRGQRIEVVIDESIALAPRCGVPVALLARGQLVLQVHLALREMLEALRSGALPAPIDGVIHVDRSASPAILDAVLEELTERSPVSCAEAEVMP